MKLSFIPILLFSAFALTAQAMVGMNIKRSNAKFTFPRYSYTVITLKK